ncbi:hypothetical protein ES288_A03G052600v1 [Gossypium darwinii]|uniref:SOSEKI DIX-like domain-containing protein n=1 Tax=Gossypium darwinii TaxID=34276 RepID=A0A5D2H184_GOSDA|nr:hypothetical protein ES288_A03G052600v1 [Gossypium darwinii]
MAVSSRGRMIESGVVSRKWKETVEISPERNKVWVEPKPLNTLVVRKVAVVYYLSRNGQLQHPHFMQVPLSSNAGLYLKDVIKRLNLLRGKGMASLYSWSSKRCYKNGFVWHDLAEDDIIYPSHGQEYVLKGSEILDHSINLLESEKLGKDHDFQPIRRQRDPSRSSIDLPEHKIFTADSSSDSPGKLAVDASTQTDDKRRKPVVKESKIERLQSQELEQNQSTELRREDISPPRPSDSSSETLESLMKADALRSLCEGDGKEDNLNRSGRMKASAVLMQLISCGSVSIKEFGGESERDQGFSLTGHYQSRLPRGAGNRNQMGKEHFSGSLSETKREGAPDLKRSSGLQLAERETKAKAGSTKKQGKHEYK